MTGGAFLTGATGVLGSEVAQLMDPEQLICLTHNEQPQDPEFRTVQGDVTQSGLGIEPTRRKELEDDVTTIIHCAGETDFVADHERFHLLNVIGTTKVLEFASDIEAEVAYVSTAFVDRLAADRPERRDENAGHIRPEGYLKSKSKAEELVRQSHVPSTIIRPSIILANSQSGAIRRHQGIHAVVGAICRDELPVVPVDPTARIDVVPSDLVGRAIAEIAFSPIQDGDEHWLTAGRSAPTANALLELLVASMNEHGVDVEPPRLISMDMMQRLIGPVFIDRIPEDERAGVERVLGLSALFDTERAFPSSIERLDSVTISPALIHQTFERLVARYWGPAGTSSPDEHGRSTVGPAFASRVAESLRQ